MTRFYHQMNFCTYIGLKLHWTRILEERGLRFLMHVSCPSHSFSNIETGYPNHTLTVESSKSSSAREMDT